MNKGGCLVLGMLFFQSGIAEEGISMVGQHGGSDVICWRGMNEFTFHASDRAHGQCL